MSYSILNAARETCERQEADGHQREPAEIEGHLAGLHLGRLRAARNLLLASKAARAVEREALRDQLAALDAADENDEAAFYSGTSFDRFALQEWVKQSPNWQGIRGKSRPFAGEKLGSRTETVKPSYKLTDDEMLAHFAEFCQENTVTTFDRVGAKAAATVNAEEVLDETTGAVYPPGTVLLRDGLVLNINVTPGHSEERYYAEIGSEKVWLDIYHDAGDEPEEEDQNDE